MAENNENKGHIPPSHEDYTKPLAHGKTSQVTVELNFNKNRYPGTLLSSGAAKDSVSSFEQQTMEDAKNRFGNDKEFTGRSKVIQTDVNFSKEIKVADYVLLGSGSLHTQPVSDLDNVLSKEELSKKNEKLLKKVWNRIRPQRQTATPANTAVKSNVQLSTRTQREI